ncbi:MAG: sialidase family protein [Planctomycetia bacterium]|nr:sialidase family protein [Planctomycetia bacterium]
MKTRLELLFLGFLTVLMFAGFGEINTNLMSQEFDPLSPPPILQPIPVQYEDAKRQWQGISSLEASSNDRLWVAWYSGGKTECRDNYVLLATSGDRGETWSKPILAIDPPGMTRAFDPAIWLDPKGKLWLFWSQGEEYPEGPMPIWDGRVGVWAITTENPDSGENAIWSEPFRICDGIMMGKPIVDSQNRWLFPVAIWRFAGKYKTPAEHVGVAVWVSTDEGKQIEFLGRAQADPAISLFDEHNIIEMKDHSFKMFARTRYGIGETSSKDGGRTWTDLAPSTISHTSSRFFMRRLASGNLLLVKNGPIDQDVGRKQIMAFLSTDDGQTWSNGLMIDERNNVSYPDGNQTSDGTIYLTYDFERTKAREIYAARFTEADILAGRIISDSSKLRLVVNRASGPLPNAH